MVDLTINLRGLRAVKIVGETMDRIDALPCGERRKNDALSKLPVIVARTRRRAGVR